MEDIQKELQEILGSREQVKVDVAYTSFEEHQTTENQSRVK
jgi:hypothetical protein